MADFEIAGQKVAPGEQKILNMPLSRLPDGTRMTLTAQVINGKQDGPVMFVSGAIHGDEIIGTEIVRRLSKQKAINGLRGTLILIPIVNTYGFITLSRYLPDRRDLNRCFPGRAHGSLGSQLAHVFMTEIVQRADYGIDLHSAAVHRDNLPQIRASLGNQIVDDMARAFGAYIIIDSNVRDGSLRQVAQDGGCNMLLYEAGEALRFDELAIRIGVKGVVNVMRHVGMLKASKKTKPPHDAPISDNSTWIRAAAGGVMRTYFGLGDKVQEGDLLAHISDPLGQDNISIIADEPGLVIGRTNLPIVNQGDALFHIASLKRLNAAADSVDTLVAYTESDPMHAHQEIV